MSETQSSWSASPPQSKLNPNITYVGVVTGNADPLQRERVQVSIPGITDRMPPADRPWWIPSSKRRMCGGKAASGDSYVPEIGSNVEVFFPEGDLHKGRYLDYTTTADSLIPEASIAYPNTPVIFRFPDGVVLFYNKPTKELCLRNPVGTLKLRIQGDVNMLVDSGNVNIECNTARVNCRNQAAVHAQATDIFTNRFSINRYRNAPKPDVGPYAKKG